MSRDRRGDGKPDRGSAEVGDWLVYSQGPSGEAHGETPMLSWRHRRYPQEATARRTSNRQIAFCMGDRGAFSMAIMYKAIRWG